VAFAPRRLGLEENEVRERVRKTLGLLDAGHLGERSPHALSGGEKRRVAIAGVLAMGPEVLVLDEPTAGLDPATREDLLGVVRGLREAGTSVVMVSHDLDEVAEVADRVCVLEEGEVRAAGAPGEVFYARPAEAPATVRTASLLRGSHPEVGRPVRFDETLAALRGLLGA
jgi:energy-coupling factor transport system ATP-binding protein